MDTTTLAKYLKTAFEAVPCVYTCNDTVKTGGFSWTGWYYAPTTLLENDGFGQPHSSSQPPYFVSRPTVTALASPDAGFNVSFTFGAMDSLSSLKLYAVTSINLDTDGKPRDDGKVTVYTSSASSPLPNVPLTGEIAGLSDPTNFVLWSFEYANELNEWITEQGLDDTEGVQLALGSFLQIFYAQAQSAISLAFAGRPSVTPQYAQAVAKPFTAAVRGWPDVTWKRVGEDRGAYAYFDYTYSGKKLRCWMPTLLVGPLSWSAVLKFDLIRSMAKDDHVVMYVMGSFALSKSDLAAGHGPTIDKVLAVSATTDYEHSDGEDLLVSTSQPTDGGAPVDVEDTWLTSWAAENATEPPEVLTFSQGVAELFQQFVTQIRTVTGAPTSNFYDVSAGGNGKVSLSITSGNAVMAGCSGRVFQLDPYENASILHQITLARFAHVDVELVCCANELYAAGVGAVVALAVPTLTPLWPGEYLDLSAYTGSAPVHPYVADGRIFAAAHGYVLEIAPYKIGALPSIKWAYELADLYSGFGAEPVSLALESGTLYCGSNGFVAALDVSGTSPVPRATVGSKSYYNLPSCGNHATTVVSDPRGVYAACHGYVYGLDPTSYGVLWTTELSSINGNFGNHAVSLAIHAGTPSGLLAGSHGRVARLGLAGGGAIADANGKADYGVHDGGASTTTVRADGPDAGGLAGCEGWVYRLDPSYYNTATWPADKATIKYELLLPHTGDVRLATLGNIVFAGMKGQVQAMSLDVA